MRSVNSSLNASFALGMYLVAVINTAAADDSVAAFYRGRTVQAIVGYTPGSTFEFYLRAFAPHFSRHVPGNPTIIIQHMPGAGSLKAAAYLANVAPKDGSVFGIINPVNTIEPLLDPANAKFDPLTFMWLGSLNAEISTCAFWSQDLKTLVDLRHREVVVGSTGPASGSTVDARVLGPLTGINFKIVTSYPGLAEVRLAAERGEVDGHCGLQVSAIKSLLWDDFRAGRFSVPIQMGLRKHPDLPDVPNAYDLAASEEDRALFRLNFGPWSFGRPLLAPPGTPGDTRAASRPGFVAATKRNRGPVNPADYTIRPEFKPGPEDVVITKQRASVFFGTPLMAHLTQLGIRTLIICGESTSGCVRASAVDAYSNGLHVVLVEECCFDRSLLSHKVNLFDMHHKYADVMHFEKVIAHLKTLAAQRVKKAS